jgi:hypothetical protein
MITRADAKGLALWGLVGCIAGMCFQASNLYIDRKFDFKIEGLEVDSLREDKVLLQQVHLLQQYARVDVRSFQSAALAMDKFLRMELIAQDTSNTAPSPVDCRVQAFLHYKDALAYLKSLYESSKTKECAQTQAAVYRIISNIFPQLHQHWTSVMSLTARK